jgi:spiro-SPASM protein
MSQIGCILSLLHEPTEGSATRLFRKEPVLRWTLERLSRASRLGPIGVLCWDDQAESVRSIANAFHVTTQSKGPRTRQAQLDSISAAQRWSNGWRGGLMLSCPFDLGFHAQWHDDLRRTLECDAVALVDPAAALIDPQMIDALIARASEYPNHELYFAPAPPGLGAAILRGSLMGRLASANTHAGRLLHYHPDALAKDVLASEACVPVPTAVARSTEKLLLDTDRQVRRVEAATSSLNGELMTSTAPELVGHLQAHPPSDPLPRHVILELNTVRSTQPIYWPGKSLDLRRPDLTLALAERLMAQLSLAGDVRLTLAGAGDPILHPDLFAILELARREGCMSVHLETDLYEISPDRIRQLAAAPVDVISVNIPAFSSATYARVMGCDGCTRVIENIRLLATERHARGAGVPLIVPTFTKCRENLAEMEAWYDQWLGALGSAVIKGPSDFGGRIPDVAVADMCPPARRPCARLGSRLTVLCDGRVVSCEEDVLGLQSMGRIGSTSLRDIWVRRQAALRADHVKGDWNQHPVCKSCREWHRA